MVRPKKIRELFADSSKWTQRVGSRDAAGNQCGSMEDYATCWCLAVAIDLVYFAQVNQPTYNEILHTAAGYIEKKCGSRLGCISDMALVVKWNDMPGRTFEDVQELVTELNI